jgi:Fe-S-cluster-containing dehydrogenase component
MKISRKEFLRATGISLLAVVTRKVKGAAATRWALAVDTTRCKDNCSGCIAACNQAHNIPSIPQAGREVRWIWRDTFEHAFPGQEDAYSTTRSAPAMVLCNHCDNPPCVRVCPTQATFKREDGIVAMDYHRCIGCRYCMAACPYGSRSFNWMDPRPYIKTPNPEFPTRTKGVVEKCTLCSERLAVGKPPACVEGCPEKALVFGNLSDPHSSVRELLASRRHARRRPELGTGPGVFYIL